MTPNSNDAIRRNTIRVVDQFHRVFLVKAGDGGGRTPQSFEPHSYCTAKLPISADRPDLYKFDQGGFLFHLYQIPWKKLIRQLLICVNGRARDLLSVHHFSSQRCRS